MIQIQPMMLAERARHTRSQSAESTAQPEVTFRDRTGDESIRSTAPHSDWLALGSDTGERRQRYSELVVRD